MNMPLSQAYDLKEQLQEIWIQINKEEVEMAMLDRIKQVQKRLVADEDGDHGEDT